VPLAEGRRRIPTGVGIQGNLEPAVCLGPWELVEQRVRDVLEAADGAVDHVFNLGHGVLPATDPAVLQRVVELVHQEGRVTDARGRGAEPVDG
jgi:uroporphyrinogen decarboxylase